MVINALNQIPKKTSAGTWLSRLQKELISRINYPNSSDDFSLIKPLRTKQPTGFSR